MNRLTAITISLVIGTFWVGTPSQILPPKGDDTAAASFVKNRPAGAAQRRPRPKAVYRPAAPTNLAIAQPPDAPPRTQSTPKAPTGKSEPVEIGVTLWRLEPSAQSTVTGSRMLVHEGGNSQQTASYTPQRMQTDKPIAAGEYVRLTVESPRKGYLYVVDREQYADGSIGEPVLIFPTTRTRGGDNQVEAGRLIEIPAREDNPNYFTLRPNKNSAGSEQVSELLSIIVAPEPIGDFRIGRESTPVPKDQFADWESKYATEAQHLELENGAGTGWTNEEKAGGEVGSRRLTQDDPLPQTIYRLMAQAGSPIIVNVPLKISK